MQSTSQWELNSAPNGLEDHLYSSIYVFVTSGPENVPIIIPIKEATALSLGSCHSPHPVPILTQLFTDQAHMVPRQILTPFPEGAPHPENVWGTSPRQLSKQNSIKKKKSLQVKTGFPQSRV